MPLTRRFRIRPVVVSGILLGAAFLCMPGHLAAQDAPNCLPPFACDRFGQRTSQRVDSTSVPRDTVTVPRETQRLPMDTPSKPSQRGDHMVRGAEIGLGAAAIASLAMLSQGCTPKGSDMQGLCTGLEIVATGVTLFAGFLGGSLVGALWPTH